MEKVLFAPSSQVVTSKMALIAVLESKVAGMKERIAQYERKLSKYTRSNEPELVAMYEQKLARVKEIKVACEETIFRQKQFIKGK